MTVLEVIQRSTEFLARKGVDSPRLQVELLLAHTLKLPRLRLYLDFERQLTEAELDSLRTGVKRRANREPLQHIIGATSFCGLEMKVNPNVLIPRPETEVLAESAWGYLGRAPANERPLMALDFGTGSGCLAIALAVRVPAAQIWALDTSSEALAVARENAQVNGVAERIRFVEGNGLSCLPPDLRFELIVSNPPYIPSGEIAQLMPEVRDYDPRLALDGGPDGLTFFRQLAAEARGRMQTSGQIMCEFGDGQADALRKLFTAEGWDDIAVRPDLSGRPRILVARWGKS